MVAAIAAKELVVVALYPLFGAVVGAAGGLIFFLLPPTLNAVATGFWFGVAGLKDRACVRPGWRLVFMRIAVAAVWFPVLLPLQPSEALAYGVAVHTIARAATITLVWCSRPAAAGIAWPRDLRSAQAIAAAAQGLAASLLAGPRIAIGLLLAVYLMVRTVQAWAYRRQGGVSSDTVAFTRLGGELLLLLLVALLT